MTYFLSKKNPVEYTVRIFFNFKYCECYFKHVIKFKLTWNTFVGFFFSKSKFIYFSFIGINMGAGRTSQKVSVHENNFKKLFTVIKSEL